MIYCNFDQGEVEIHKTIWGGFVCKKCRFNQQDNLFITINQMIIHLEKHQRAYHIFPDEVLQSLYLEKNKKV